MGKERLYRSSETEASANQYSHSILSNVKTRTSERCGSLTGVGDYLFSRAVTSQVSSARQSLTSVFGMGTGGPSASMTPTVAGLKLFASSLTRSGRVSIENRTRDFFDSNSFFENLVVQAFGLLVSVSSTHCCAYTSDLSNL